ncbi:MAG: hypothetical protein DRJ15_10770 [Bacteroidetes bacterium]|nr:MAG: hypothetical protein DRJ15_10770 [Bacteroidota bacterium]
MPVETASTISELDPSWPLGGDPTNQGDNHIRTIKDVLQLQFPGSTSAGFNIPIITTEQELNWSVGLVDNIQVQFNDLQTRITGLEGVLSAEPGTAMVFYQGSPPTGWTQTISDAANDRMLRLVTSTGGGVGGTTSPIIAHTHTTTSHTLTTAQMPSHAHTWDTDGPQYAGQYTGVVGHHPDTAGNLSGYTGGGGSHTHGNTGEFAGPRYIDTILCVKD